MYSQVAKIRESLAARGALGGLRLQTGHVMDRPRTSDPLHVELAIAYQAHGMGDYELLLIGSIASNSRL
jgi:hypothetical protein